MSWKDLEAVPWNCLCNPTSYILLFVSHTTAVGEHLSHKIVDFDVFLSRTDSECLHRDNQWRFCSNFLEFLQSHMPEVPAAKF